jgi:ribosomal subunit interface protein
VDIVVKGRNVEVPDHYRQHVAEKLHKVERYDHKIIRVDVELFHERNPRQSDNCQRVEITCYSRGPVVRAEACAADFYSALDAVINKLDARLRRAADRRRVHRGRRAPLSVAAATAGLIPAGLTDLSESTLDREAVMMVESAIARSNGHRPQKLDIASLAALDEDTPWHVVREKEHSAEPMTLDDALFHMELVGHDFYLFMDKESGRPSVVYRRHAYDYGVIALA